MPTYKHDGARAMAIIAGVDGGGFKTETAVVDTSRKKLIGYGLSGPSNYHNIGLDRTVENILDSIVKAVLDAGIGLDDIDSICISLAALDTRFDREYVVERLETLGVGRKIVIEHDAHEALMAGGFGEPGISVIAGTGSIAYGWDGRNRYIAGDHGWLLGDQGSGFWIGFRAIRDAVKMLDGRMEKTLLADLVLKYFSVSDKEELSYTMYRRSFSVEEIAGLAPVVAEAARKGDRYAIEILVRAGYELGEATIAVAKKMSIDVINVYYTGGVFNIEYVERAFVNKLSSMREKVLRPHRLVYKPVLGSLVIAAKSIGLEVNWSEIEGLDLLRVKPISK